MTTPIVIEIPRPPEPVTRDSFVDDRTRTRPDAGPADGRKHSVHR
jgi:hypothetical protein